MEEAFGQMMQRMAALEGELVQQRQANAVLQAAVSQAATLPQAQRASVVDTRGHGKPDLSTARDLSGATGRWS